MVVIPVRSMKSERTITGGAMQLGSDVAVAHLQAPVERPTYFRIDAIHADDIGKRLGVIGYGIQDDVGSLGTRKLGLVTMKALAGNVIDLAFGSFDAWRERRPVSTVSRANCSNNPLSRMSSGPRTRRVACCRGTKLSLPGATRTRSRATATPAGRWWPADPAAATPSSWASPPGGPRQTGNTARGRRLRNDGPGHRRLRQP